MWIMKITKILTLRANCDITMLIQNVGSERYEWRNRQVKIQGHVFHFLLLISFLNVCVIIHSQEQEAREKPFQKPEDSNFAGVENYPSRFKQWNIFPLIRRHVESEENIHVFTVKVWHYCTRRWNLSLLMTNIK